MAGDVLVVASKVREAIKAKEMMMSGELIEALSKRVHDLLDAAMERTRGNKRSTVKAVDL